VPSILALTVLTLGGAFAVFTYFAPLISSELGVGPDAVAAYLMLFGVAAFIGNLVGGNVADKVPAGRALATILMVLATTSAAVAIAGGLPHGAAAIVLPIAIAIWGLFGWSFLPIQQARLVSVNPAMATVLLSLNASAIYVGVALGSALGGAVIAHGPVHNLGWVSVACDLVALTVLTLTARRPATANPDTIAVESPAANAAE
jgi:predicted MFS family arabinose efflux permease